MSSALSTSLRTAGRSLAANTRFTAAVQAPKPLSLHGGTVADLTQTRGIIAGQAGKAPQAAATTSSRAAPANPAFASGLPRPGVPDSWLAEMNRAGRRTAPEGVKDIDIAIAEDHSEIFATYSKYSVTHDPRDKRHLLADLVRRIAVHSAAEETVVSPKFLSIPDHPGLHAEHADVRDSLVALERPGLTQEAFDRELSAIILDLKTHVAAEETITLPALRASLIAQGEEGVAALRTLGAVYRAATAAVGRLNVHTFLKGGAATQLEAGSVAAIYDTVRAAVEKQAA